MQGVAVDLQGVLQSVIDLFGQAGDPGAVVGAGDPDDEFVAGQAGDHPFVADDLFQSSGQFDENPVAGVVAQRVVDLFETVQIQEEEGTAPVVFPGVAESGFEGFEEFVAVGQAGERVGPGQGFEVSAQLFGFGLVPNDSGIDAEVDVGGANAEEKRRAAGRWRR